MNPKYIRESEIANSKYSAIIEIEWEEGEHLSNIGGVNGPGAIDTLINYGIVRGTLPVFSDSFTPYWPDSDSRRRNPRRAAAVYSISRTRTPYRHRHAHSRRTQSSQCHNSDFVFWRFQRSIELPDFNNNRNLIFLLVIHKSNYSSGHTSSCFGIMEKCYIFFKIIIYIFFIL